MHCEGGLSRPPLFYGGNIQCDLVRIGLTDDRGSAMTKGAAA
jgi:hypothetical protein